ncbi:hypothetical protein ACSMX9_18785 [Streptomyces sp. LE64]|uniref:hypothetical protein n=1 Tax=unclassified Streptomyces TaxID=2593676 RepID=UPI0033246558
MSLVELISEADERGLAVSGLACLDRCVSLLGGDDELLRPLWAVLSAGGDAGQWGERVDLVRTALAEATAGGECATEDEAGDLALRMLADAPVALPYALRGGDAPDPGLRTWADDCSLASLRIHLLLDPARDGVAEGAVADSVDEPLVAAREDRAAELPPLAAAELRRQQTTLELVAARGTGGMRQAHAVTTEGRRVLRAVVSRRARGRN